jgi:hypothetical protein
MGKKLPTRPSTKILGPDGRDACTERFTIAFHATPEQTEICLNLTFWKSLATAQKGFVIQAALKAYRESVGWRPVEIRRTPDLSTFTELEL